MPRCIWQVAGQRIGQSVDTLKGQPVVLIRNQEHKWLSHRFSSSSFAPYNLKQAIIAPISAAPTTQIPPIQAAHTAPVTGAAAQAVVQVPAIR